MVVIVAVVGEWLIVKELFLIEGGNGMEQSRRRCVQIPEFAWIRKEIVSEGQARRYVLLRCNIVPVRLNLVVRRHRPQTYWSDEIVPKSLTLGRPYCPRFERLNLQSSFRHDSPP